MRLNQEARIYTRTLRELEGAMQLRELSQMHVKAKCFLSQMPILYSFELKLIFSFDRFTL